MKPGRPTSYSDDLIAAILTRIVGGEGLVRICRDDSMPSVATVYSWLQTNQEFLDRYIVARNEQADTLADEIIDLADDATNEGVAKARLQVDARKWVAAKLKPKKYGDKLTNEHTGIDGGPIRHSHIETIIVDPVAEHGPEGIPTAAEVGEI